MAIAQKREASGILSTGLSSCLEQRCPALPPKCSYVGVYGLLCSIEYIKRVAIFSLSCRKTGWIAASWVLVHPVPGDHILPLRGG